MHHLVAVEVDRPGEEGVGLVLVDLLGQQQGVGAEDDELLPLQETLDDLGHVLVQQGLAPGDGHHRSAALVDGLHALSDAQALVQDLVRIVDLATAGAGQVAAEQGLEHQHQGVAFRPSQLLLHDVGADPGRHREWNAH